MSLMEVQCHLDREGASDLVIDLIMNTTSDPCLPRKHPIGHCTVGGWEHHHTGQKDLSVKLLSNTIERCGIKLFNIPYILKDGVSKTFF